MDPLHFSLPCPHALVVATTYADRSDEVAELVHEQTWQLHPVHKELRVHGSLVTLLDPATGEGLVWLREAPTAFVRQWDTEPLLTIRSTAHGWEARAGATALPYPTHLIPFRDGWPGRTRALQAWQHERHPLQAGRDGLILTNTWGDRSRADRMSEAFVLAEIEGAAAWGAEVVQLDDGWQQGRTSNTSADGVWNDFWATDEAYWQPDPQRFPRGLQPVVEAARQRGLRLGLWYAPDSSDDFRNHDRDADTILALWHRYGVCHYKLDGIKIHSPGGERNLRKLLARLYTESDGAILVDLDTTAESRLGFWGHPVGSALFVENRYTDWGNYYPHTTLRTLWALAGTVAPTRLRMEFLNPYRHDARYGEDPLRPSQYRPAYLFATVMLASPLGWFENTGLPPSMVAALTELVAVWKEHREQLQRGVVYPLGTAPTGYSWTGFAIHDETSPALYLLVFRENTAAAAHRFVLPAFLPRVTAWRVLAGDSGCATVEGNHPTVTLASPRSFLLLAASLG